MTYLIFLLIAVLTAAVAFWLVYRLLVLDYVVVVGFSTDKRLPALDEACLFEMRFLFAGANLVALFLTACVVCLAAT